MISRKNEVHEWTGGFERFWNESFERLDEGVSELQRMERDDDRGSKGTTHAFEFRPGGVWKFDMHGPDGTVYPNRIEWREIVPLERLAEYLKLKEQS